jgi:5'-nucleotidase
MRVLVTNDDGVDAPGIHVLAGALAAAGHEVLVVAPADDRSGSGAAIGKVYRDRPLPVVDHVWDDLPEIPVKAIDAPPATAVLAAVLGAFGDPPDLVASGINPGANTGHLVIHSGTVGAALTAAGLDVPGIAVSTQWSTTGDYHWEAAAAAAVAAVGWVTEPDVVPRVVNINAPNLPFTDVLGVRETELAPHGEVWIASADASSGNLELDVKGRADAAPGTDVAAVASGYVSVTPLRSVVRAEIAGAADALRAVLGG